MNAEAPGAAPDKGRRPVRSARVWRVPLLAIVLACIVASVLDVSAALALGVILDRRHRAALLDWEAAAPLAGGFRTLGGALCYVDFHDQDSRRDFARDAIVRGARIGLLVALSASALAAIGRLRVRLGGAS